MPDHVKPHLAGTSDAQESNSPLDSLKGFLHEQEVLHIKKALAIAEGDKEKAASLLGISLATLYRKLMEIGD